MKKETDGREVITQIKNRYKLNEIESIESIDSNVNKQDDKTNFTKTNDDLYLFISFDICNSTALKSKIKDWYKLVNILKSNKILGMDFWKFNGDEVIYRREVNSLKYICGEIKEAYRLLETMSRQMTDIAKEVNVYLKSTVWIARVSKKADASHDNILLNFNGFSEYIGKNIDEGFRLTKCTIAQRVVIDPKIIYLLLLAQDTVKNPLSEQTRFVKSVKQAYKDDTNNLTDLFDIINSTYFVGCEKCKGIWNDMPYPIFWYYNNEIVKTNKLDYNQFFNGEHLWRKNIEKVQPTFISELAKIFEITGVLDQVKEIMKLINMVGTVDSNAEDHANLYYMVACVNKKLGKVMIGQRSNNRKHLKGVWDFGNVKYKKVDIITTIKNEYLDTFGLNINIVTDEERGNCIVPFGYCTIYRNCVAHNSLLLFATIEGVDDYTESELVEKIKNYAKDDYQDIKFVTPDDVTDLKPLTLNEIRLDSGNDDDSSKKNYEVGENRCIMYFENSIRKALDNCL